MDSGPSQSSNYNRSVNFCHPYDSSPDVGVMEAITMGEVGGGSRQKRSNMDQNVGGEVNVKVTQLMEWQQQRERDETQSSMRTGIECGGHMTSGTDAEDETYVSMATGVRVQRNKDRVQLVRENRGRKINVFRSRNQERRGSRESTVDGVDSIPPPFASWTRLNKEDWEATGAKPKSFTKVVGAVGNAGGGEEGVEGPDKATVALNKLEGELQAIALRLEEKRVVKEKEKEEEV